MTSTVFSAGGIGAVAGPTAGSQLASAAPVETQTAGAGGRYRGRTHSISAANSNSTNKNTNGNNKAISGNNSTPAAAAPPSTGGTVSQKPTQATILHAHRQSHNSSKLPAFRFADLKESLALPLLRNHIPPSPVSPIPGTNPDNSAAAPLDTTAGQRQLQWGHHHQASATDTDTAATDQASSTSGSGPLYPVHDSAEDDREQKRLLSLPTSIPAALPASPISPASPSPLFAVTAPSTDNPNNNSITPIKPGASQQQQQSTPASTSLSASPSRSTKRPTSYPDSPPKPTAPASTARLQRTLTDPTPPSSSLTSATKSQRRNLSSSSDGTNGQSSTLTTDNNTSRPGSSGQRELLLTKSLADNPADDRKKTSSRPPVSFRAPRNDGSTQPAIIPPIRGFRSSGSRKSLVLDMNTRNVGYDEGDMEDPNHRDRTLRALEGRPDDEFRDLTPPDSTGCVQDDEDTTDIFMKIARENSDTIRRSVEGRPAEEQNAVSRVVRSSRRRPLSAAVPSYQSTSPPQVSRRLSDQRENSRPRRTSDDQSTQQLTRELNYRSLARDKPSPSWQLSETPRTRAFPTAVRPSPITPRTAHFNDTASEVGPASSRRRPSVTDGNAGGPSRSGSYRTSTNPPPRSYNPSPLAARHLELQRNESYDQTHGREGTESSASTAAPSTVWDELDDLKSRMRRLELTGKIPPTSGAAMSRVSDDRPRTATTNATTVSGSPKRAKESTPTEVNSTTSSQREAQPILLSAMAKAKVHLPPEAYSAIESAANDALALSQMVGVAGHPGPISSGASTIGTGGPVTVTDRQLRRKADSICRSLTELCLALNDAAVRPFTESPAPKEREPVLLSSPIAARTGSSLAISHLPAQGDRALTKLTTSPRALTRLGDKRPSLLNSPAVTTPRFALSPNAGQEAAGRKSSLMIGRTRRTGTEGPDDTITDRKTSLLRTRRAGTEEPEEMSSRKPSLLRTRRAGTEEPEDDTRSSILIRSRIGMRCGDEEEEEPRFRPPSRAVTEVAGFRPAAAAPSQREYQAAMPAGEEALATSALPRRRLSRLIAPSTPTSLTGRRFAERPAGDREPTSSIGDRLAEERGQRHLSLGQTAMLNRTSSLNRRRESAIPGLAGSQLGSFR